MKTIIIDIVLAILMLIIYIAVYAVGLPLLDKMRHNDTPWMPDITTKSPLTEENLGALNTESEDKDEKT